MGIENVIFDMGNVLLRFDGMLFSRIFTKNEDDARLLDEALFVIEIGRASCRERV